MDIFLEKQFLFPPLYIRVQNMVKKEKKRKKKKHIKKLWEKVTQIDSSLHYNEVLKWLMGLVNISGSLSIIQVLCTLV